MTEPVIDDTIILTAREGPLNKTFNSLILFDNEDNNTDDKGKFENINSVN